MNKNKFNKNLTYFISGCYSSLTVLIFNCPIEHIKCRQQLEINKKITPIQVARNIISHSGYLGIFRGFWSTFNRDFLSFGVYFWTYFTLKDIYIDRYNRFGSFMQIMAGGTAGIIVFKFQE